jgi:hypothetical protein
MHFQIKNILKNNISKRIDVDIDVVKSGLVKSKKKNLFYYFIKRKKKSYLWVKLEIEIYSIIQTIG